VNKRIWLSSEKTIISTGNANKHAITKYSFKVMSKNDLLSDKKIREKYEKDAMYGTPSLDEEEIAQLRIPKKEDKVTPELVVPEPQIVQVQPQPLNNEVIEALLSKSDKLAETLSKLQMNMERQSEDFENRLAQQRDEYYQKGFNDGLNAGQSESEQKINAIKEAFLDSINALNAKLVELDGRYNNLEKELSSVAIDIAKEVIITEVSKRGGEVALALSKALIENLKEATAIKLKLNPQEMEYVKNHLEGDNRIKIESDKAISKGGVVIISDSGNIDGSVLSRYQNLKNSILESKKEDE